jgi:hypothetical protein
VAAAANEHALMEANDALINAAVRGSEAWGNDISWLLPADVWTAIWSVFFADFEANNTSVAMCDKGRVAEAEQQRVLLAPAPAPLPAGVVPLFAASSAPRASGESGVAPDAVERRVMSLLVHLLRDGVVPKDEVEEVVRQTHPQFVAAATFTFPGVDHKKINDNVTVFPADCHDATPARRRRRRRRCAVEC